MKKILIVLLFVIAGCTAPDSAREILENQGYTNVKAGGYSFFGCGSNDLWHTKFTATSPAGKEINGIVCEGVFKGATIRFK